MVKTFSLLIDQVRLLQGGGGGASVSDDENDILVRHSVCLLLFLFMMYSADMRELRAKGFNNPKIQWVTLTGNKDNRGL